MYTNSCESEKTHSMRIWRNWQTRTVQVRVNIVFVEVRILLSAPNKKQLFNSESCFFICPDSCGTMGTGLFLFLLTHSLSKCGI